ncbi:hypothetical protein EGW08_006407, partial [Elysia chlorotica]
MMGVFLQFLTAILLVSVSSMGPCSKFNKYDAEVICEDLCLKEFPPMEGFTATTFKLNGNSFSRITDKTFPHGRAAEIQISRNDFPMIVEASAFHHVSSSLAVLKLQNVHFDFDEVFEPLVGLEALNTLEIGNMKYSRNLTVPFLDRETMNRLIRLDIVHSGVVSVQPEALDSDFPRLHHIGFSYNKLRYIPEGIKRVLSKSGLRSFELDLSHNFLDTLVQEWFPLDCTITDLNLAYNNIISIRLRALNNCQLLRKLDLEGNYGLHYISPSVFPSNCHLQPRMDISVQNSGLRNVEFVLRSCVGKVFYWNSNIPCTCRYISLL